MKTHWFFIQLSVSTATRHGTAIPDDVRALSDGGARLWPATPHGALEALVEWRWHWVWQDGHAHVPFPAVFASGRAAS